MSYKTAGYELKRLQEPVGAGAVEYNVCKQRGDKPRGHWTQTARINLGDQAQDYGLRRKTVRVAYHPGRIERVLGRYDPARAVILETGEGRPAQVVAEINGSRSHLARLTRMKEEELADLVTGLLAA